jgi:hypothetical protein
MLCTEHLTSNTPTLCFGRRMASQAVPGEILVSRILGSAHTICKARSSATVRAKCECAEDGMVG